MALKAFYDYHPLAPLRLGGSFDPNSIFEPRASALTHTQTFDEGGSAQATAEAVLIQTEEHLLRTLNYDVSLEASYGIYSGKASIKSNSSFDRTSKGLALVLNAKTDFGRSFATDLALTPPAAAVIGKPEFEERFGTHYVSGVRKAAALSVVLDISQLSEETKSSLIGSVEGKGGFGPLSAKVTANLTTELTKKFKDRKVSLSVHALGGQGFSQMGELIAAMLDEGASFAVILTALKNAMNSFDRAHAAVAGYFVAPLSQFGGSSNPGNIVTYETERKLYRISRSYETAVARVPVIERLISGDDSRSGVLSQEALKLLRTLLTQYEARIKLIREAFVKLSGGDIDVEVPVVSDLDEALSRVVAPVVTLRVDDIKTGSRLSVEESREAMDAHPWPNVQVYALVQAVGIRSVEIFYRDETRPEECALLAEVFDLSNSTQQVEGNGCAVGATFPQWNSTVAPARKVPLGNGARPKGTGSYFLRVRDGLGNDVAYPLGRTTWTTDHVVTVEFPKPFWTSSLSAKSDDVFDELKAHVILFSSIISETSGGMQRPFNDLLERLRKAIANVNMKATKFYWACADNAHRGGLCKTGFATYKEAKKGWEEHMEATGHSDGGASSGECPFEE